MDLSDDIQAELLGRFGRSIAAGDTLYQAGDRADELFLLHTGRLRMVRRYRASERSLTVVRAGDLFGEEALMGEGSHRLSAAVALTDVEVIAMDRESFSALLVRQPELARHTVSDLVRRLRDLDEQLENTHLKDHGCRIINTLLRMAATVEPTPQGHSIAISPLELSSRVGLDVDAVKRAIQRLRDGGYIRIREERILLPDLTSMRQLYDLLSEKEELRRGEF